MGFDAYDSTYLSEHIHTEVMISVIDIMRCEHVYERSRAMGGYRESERVNESERVRESECVCEMTCWVTKRDANKRDKDKICMDKID